MMANGSSVRGLSLVTTTNCEPAAAARPIRGRFLRSRSPPQPQDRDDPGEIKLLQGPQGLGDSRRGMGVVHEYRGPPQWAEALQATRHPAQGRDAPGHFLRAQTQPQGGGRGRQDVGQVERPHQPGVDFYLPRRAGEPGLDAVGAEVIGQRPHLALGMAAVGQGRDPHPAVQARAPGARPD